MKINNYTVPFVVKMIQEIYKLDEQRFYKADLSASDLLMDLNLILSKINLTNKQAFILEKYWQEGYTQDEVAEMLGITQQMCVKHCNAIRKKIRKVLIEMEEIQNDDKE